LLIFIWLQTYIKYAAFTPVKIKIKGIFIGKNTKDRETTHEEIMEKARRYGIKYIDLKIDYAFKLVFGTHGQEDLLLKLIDSILPDKHIVSVKLGPQEQMLDSLEKRRSIYDIHCTTARLTTCSFCSVILAR